MQLTILKRILITLFSTMILVSCGGKKTEEIDISALQLIPKKEKKIITEEVEEKVSQPVINNLKPLLNKDQLNKTINLGRTNPFGSIETEDDETLEIKKNFLNQ